MADGMISMTGEWSLSQAGQSTGVVTPRRTTAVSPQRHRPHSDSFIKTKVKMTVLSQRVYDLTNCH